jgi:hypothetical protein
VIVPDQPVGALTDLSGPLLAVDDEHAAWANDHMVQVGGRVGQGQIMEDHIAVAAEAVQQPGGMALAFGATLPGPGLFGGAEP